MRLDMSQSSSKGKSEDWARVEVEALVERGSQGWPSVDYIGQRVTPVGTLEREFNLRRSFAPHQVLVA